jgi:hypothetical protein
MFLFIIIIVLLSRFQSLAFSMLILLYVHRKRNATKRKNFIQVTGTYILAPATYCIMYVSVQCCNVHTVYICNFLCMYTNITLFVMHRIQYIHRHIITSSCLTMTSVVRIKQGKGDENKRRSIRWDPSSRL